MRARSWLAPLLLAVVLTPGTGRAWPTLLPGTPDNGRPFALASDASGNVVVGGRVTPAAGDDDGVLAKLAAGDGAVLWQQRFDGTALAGAGGEDLASEAIRSVAVAPNGDALGAGVLVGTTTGADVLVTRRASADGAFVWDVLLDGGANLADSAQALAMDPSGDVIVTGTITTTGAASARPLVLKLAGGNGAESWRAVLPDGGGVARALAIDASGDALVAADVGANWIVTKRAGADGAELWRTDLAGDPGDAQATAMALRPGGAPVVAGRLFAAATGQDFTVVALSAAGSEQWRYTLDGTAVGAADEDAAFSVTVDAAGDVLAAGVISNATTDDDLVVVKLDGDSGAEQWRVVVNGSNDNNDDASAVMAAASGEVFVVGSIRNRGGSGRDLFVLSLDGASGQERWRRVVDGETSQADMGTAGALDADGHVLAAGRTRNGPTADGFTILKVSPATGADFPCGNAVTDAGEACDDGNLATGDGCRPDCTVEACGDGIVDPEETCDDGNTEDGDCCSATCTTDEDGAACDDKNACTDGDACTAGVCHGAATVCPASNDCHQGVCNPATGACSEITRPNGRLCDDGDACTVSDQCTAGECVSGPARVCDDFDPCTADSCDPAAGCTYDAYTSFDGVSCAFDPTRIATFCFTGLPGKIDRLISRAESRVEKAAATSQTGRARRFLKSARNLAEQARRRADKKTASGKLSPACGAALDDVLSDVGTRALGLRDALPRD